jgi:hypothetical protein
LKLLRKTLHFKPPPVNLRFFHSGVYDCTT